jgi:hypothetical protein
MKSKSQMKNTTLLQKLLAIQFGIEDARRQLSWNRGIENVLGTLTKKGKSSKWWFDKIHPEDSIKCLSDYSLLEQKLKIGRSIPFQMRNDSYKYVLDRGFY